MIEVKIHFSHDVIGNESLLTIEKLIDSEEKAGACPLHLLENISNVWLRFIEKRYCALNIPESKKKMAEAATGALITMFASLKDITK